MTGLMGGMAPDVSLSMAIRFPRLATLITIGTSQNTISHHALLSRSWRRFTVRAMLEKITTRTKMHVTIAQSPSDAPPAISPAGPPLIIASIDPPNRIENRMK